MGLLTQQLLTRKPMGTLYHYTNQVGLLSILETKTLWASKMQYLNDASELLHSLNILKMIITKRKSDAKSYDEIELLGKLEKALRFIYTVHVFVGSLSAAGDLLSQWRSYCPDGSGFSIGFEPTHLHSALSQYNFLLAPCVYDSQEQWALLNELVDDALDPSATFTENSFLPEVNPGLARLSEKLGPRASNFLKEFLKVGSLLKNDSFRQEEEWRIVCGVIPDNNPEFQIRTGRSMLTPYRKVKLHGEDGLVQIDELIVGPTPHKDLAKQAAWNLLNSRCSNGIIGKKVKSSRIPYRGW
jgi:Protein of unknown function (DUF2971)